MSECESVLICKCVILTNTVEIQHNTWVSPVVELTCCRFNFSDTQRQREKTKVPHVSICLSLSSLLVYVHPLLSLCSTGWLMAVSKAQRDAAGKSCNGCEDLISIVCEFYMEECWETAFALCSSFFWFLHSICITCFALIFILVCVVLLVYTQIIPEYYVHWRWGLRYLRITRCWSSAQCPMTPQNINVW